MSLTAEHRPVLSTVANTTRRTDGNDRNDALTVRTPLPPCGRVSPADAVEAAARRPVTSPGEVVICHWASDTPTPVLARTCALTRQAGGELATADSVNCRVAPVHCCTGAPSGPCMHVPAHTAQASPKGRFSTALKILRRSRRASFGGPPVRSPRCSTCPSVPASAPASLQRLTCPRQRPCGHEHQARYPASYTSIFREETRPCGARFPAAFQPPAFASWAPCPASGVPPLLRSAYRRACAYPCLHGGPWRGLHVPHA